MLVLSRRVGERIVIPELGIELTLLKWNGTQARLGITAPKEVAVYRSEVHDEIAKGIAAAKAAK